MARGEPLIRQWRLLQVLQARRFGIGADELAEELGCSKRQVQRDLQVLQAVGFPITFERRDYGKRFWKLSSDFLRRGELILSVTEMLSLFLSRQILAPLTGTQLGDGLATALDKIKALLPPKALVHFDRLDESLLVKSMPRHDYSGQDKEIRLINRAVTECRLLKVRYRSAHSGRVHEWHCRPFGLVLFGMSLYCVAHVVEHGEVRTLKVERILGVERTARTFQRPGDFSLREHFQGSFGVFAPGRAEQIVVRFGGWAATNVRELQWHPTQKLLRDTPDHVVAAFNLADTTEFKRWLLGFGRHATVLRPKRLAEEIAEELRIAAAGYEKE